MTDDLRILIVEDVPFDAELAAHELETVLHNFTVHVVDTKKDFLQALKTFKPDLILSDYKLPTFDGLAALRLAREKAPFIPFVILTGSMNEESAVECMKAGADDYVIKEHLDRLGPAVAGAIEKKKLEQERIQALQALRESEERNRAITETAADAIISINSDGIILSWNNAAEKIFGYSKSDMLNKTLTKIIPAQYKSGHRAGIKRLQKRGAQKLIGKTIEIAALHKNGTEFPIELSLSKWETENGAHFTGIIRDISERVRTEESTRKSQQQLTTVINAAKDAIIVMNNKGSIIVFNAAAEKIFGRQAREMIGQTVEILMPKSLHAQHKKDVASFFATGKPDGVMGRTVEVQAVRANGEEFPIEFSLAHGGEGESAFVLGVIRDISERAQAEETLRENEKQFRAIVENSHDGILVVDESYKIVYANNKFCELLGYPREDIVGRDFRTFLDEESRELVAKRYKMRQRGKEAPRSYEFNIVKKTGEKRRVEIISTVIKNSEGRIQTIAHILDITERKQAQKELRDREIRFRSIFENAQDAIFIMDDHKFIDCNPATARIFGCNEKADILGHSPWEFSPSAQPDGRSSQEKAIGYITAALAGAPQIFYWRHIKKDGTPFDAEVSLNLIVLEGENFLQAIVHDITERKQAEAKLRKQEEEYRSTVNVLRGGVIMHNADTSILLSNPAASDILGLTVDELLGKKAIDPAWMFVHEDLAPVKLEEYPVNKVLATKKPLTNYALGIIHPARETITWVIVNAVPLFSAEDELEKVVVNFIDITEVKQTQHKLEESEEKYRSLIDQSQDAIYLLHENKFEIINRRFTELFGYTLAETQADDFDFRQLLAPESLPIIEDRLARSKRGEELEPVYEFVALAKDGRKIDCEVSTSYIDYRGGKATQGILRDISDRKRAEATLKEERQVLRTLIDNLPDNVYIKDAESRFIAGNKTVALQMGAESPEELIGKTDFDFYDKEYADDYFADEQNIIRTGVPIINKEELISDVDSGKKRWASTTKVPLLDAQGKAVGIIGVGHDITNRKAAEQEISRQRKKLADILRATNAGTWEWDVQTGHLHVNERWAEIIGYTVEELQPLNTKTWAESLHPDDFKAANESLEKHFAGELDYYDVEFRQQHKNGSWVWVHARGMVIEWLEEGKPLRMSGTHVDITKRKQTEQKLQQSENRYRAIFECKGTATLIIGGDASIQMANLEVLSLTGYQPEELVGSKWMDFVAPASLAKMLEYHKKRRKAPNGVPERYEAGLIRKDGSLRHALIYINMIPDSDLSVVSILDITETKHAITELQKSEERFRRLFQDLGDAVFITLLDGDEEGKIIECNRAAEIQTGYDKDELVGMNIMNDLAVADSSNMPLDEWTEKLGRGEIVTTIEKKHRKDGSLYWVEVIITPIEFMGETACLSINHDISKLVEAMAEIRKLTPAVEQNTASIIITNLDGDIEYVNPQFTRITGYTAEEAKGKNPRFLQSGETKPEVYEKLWQTITGGEIWRGELINKKKNGDIFWESAIISPITDETGRTTHYLGIKDDISEKRKLEEQLRQSQKMEAVGQLAGGVAHDFNNLLTVINGYSEMLLTQMQLDEPTAKRIQQIKKAGKRAAALTGQLLAFSRRQVLKPEVLDVNELIANAEKMLKRLIGEDIDLVSHYGEALTAIEADAGQIEQIILNLAVNARDAMPDGGSLTIETRNIDLDEAYAARYDKVKAGRYVLMAVSDDGIGMDKEVQARIFEPFFTTKEKGHGTGLGLSTVYGIIKQSGGHVSVYSEPGEGTTFKIYLPAADKKAGDVEQKSEQNVRYDGDETILLVEDEEEVRNLAQTSLAELGYNLITAVDGADGLKKAKQHKEHIHLLLADVIMPNMSGKQLADRIGEFHPESKICYMSGYTDNAIMHQGVLDKGVNLIQKPFSLVELGKKVREVLEGGKKI